MQAKGSKTRAARADSGKGRNQCAGQPDRQAKRHGDGQHPAGFGHSFHAEVLDVGTLILAPGSQTGVAHSQAVRPPLSCRRGGGPAKIEIARFFFHIVAAASRTAEAPDIVDRRVAVPATAFRLQGGYCRTRQGRRTGCHITCLCMLFHRFLLHALPAAREARLPARKNGRMSRINRTAAAVCAERQALPRR